MSNQQGAETRESAKHTPAFDPLPCPFCGRKPELSHPDTLYPTGGGWKQQDGFRSYHSFREVPPEQWCYGMHCDESCGGCGAEITGDSAEEAQDKWNRRAALKAGAA